MIEEIQQIAMVGYGWWICFIFEIFHHKTWGKKTLNVKSLQFITFLTPQTPFYLRLLPTLGIST